MMNQGFTRSKYDACVYITKLRSGNYMYLLIYVDDMLIACKDKDELLKMKAQLKSEFEMKDLGPASRILGMDIKRNRSQRKLTLSQEGYLRKVVDLFGLSDSKSVTTPVGAQFKLKSVQEGEESAEHSYMKNIPYSNCVGSCMYAMISTRPDIAHGVSLISRFMSKPSREHWQAAKWLVRYIKGSLNMKMVFSGEENQVSKIVGYCDSDYAADLDKRRSLSGYVFTVGGNTVSWKASLQHVVALSTTEAEYIALTEAIKEAMWLKGFVKELGLGDCETVVHCDSQSAIHLSKNSVFHERTKHIDVRLHFIKDVINSGQVIIEKISTEINPADIFTKAVPVSKFKEALELLKLIKE